MASMKAEKAIGSSYFDQFKKEPAKATTGAPKASAAKPKPSPKKAEQKPSPKRKAKGGKPAAKN
ncbi:hypothetical protein ACHQM5_009022 [Ranunculus cassubicifolius]